MGEIVQIVRKATVRKMIVNGTLYGRIQLAVPGWLVGKEVMVIVWTEPSIEEAYLRKKGVKLWKMDEQGNIVEIKPENIELKPREKAKPKIEEAPIEEIEVNAETRPEETSPKEVSPEVAFLLEKIRREQELKNLLAGLDKEKIKGIAGVNK